MIFVTVGSTYFDELIFEIDQLAAVGSFAAPVICQIGSGKYVPKNCEWFRYTQDFQRYLTSCTLLITHGGMTALEAIWRNVNFIAVANVQVSGNHQTHFLKKLDEEYGIIWTDKLENLKTLLRDVRSRESPVWHRPPHIADFIKSIAKEISD